MAKDRVDTLEGEYLTATEEEVDYLQLTRDANESSTDYLSGNLRRQWERNLSNFQSVHPSGSKYHTASYVQRSRFFRPKTRSAIRQNEAAAVAAFFSTKDVVNIEPEDFNDESNVNAADLVKELINYHLTKNIPWFQTLIGAFQDAQVYGVVCSRQEWLHEIDKDGNKVKDHPEIVLIAPENLRIDPGSDWIDPINSSPFVQEHIPMYVGDIKAREDWNDFDDAAYLASQSDHSGDSTRLKREGNRQDSKDNTYSTVPDHQLVWVYRNVFKIDDEDIHWYSLGSHQMLSDPVPLKEVCKTGRRPWRIGNCIIESHKNYPAGLAQLGEQLQAATNENFNQRFDNVKLVLNGRHLVDRNDNIDLKALSQSQPGGWVMVDDTDKSVKPLDVKDITRSSYEEQDRISNDHDEIMGNFSQSSVNANANLTKTLGGMKMLDRNSNIMTEYLLRVFAETWVEPVIGDIIELEKAYEDNKKVLKLAGDRAGLPEGVEPSRDMLQGNVELTASVGFGATDPGQQVQRFMMAIKTVAEINPGIVAKVKDKEVVKEIFGQVGYKDGSRFFDGIDNERSEPEGPPPEVQVKMQELKVKQGEVQRKGKEDQMDYVLAEKKLLQEDKHFYAKLALEKEIKLPELYGKLGIEEQKLDLGWAELDASTADNMVAADLGERNHNLKVYNELGRVRDQDQKEEELSFKKETGRQGI